MTTSRRRVLRGAAAVPALGITTLRLPAALAATSASSGVGTVADGPALTPDDTRVVVTWAETDGVTYTVQQDDGAGGWTDVAASATSPTTVTGLTNDVLVTFRIVSESGGVTFEGASTSTRPRAAAVGGTESVITVDGAAWRVHQFTDVGIATLTFRVGRDVEYLIVGGGGAGGGANYGGGGGGAGAVRQNVGGTLRSVAAGPATIVVGAGGAGAQDSAGGDGTASSALGLSAPGGGGGGYQQANGRAGGSGGGAGASDNNVGRGTFKGGAGSPGRNGGASAPFYSGGGGGAVGLGDNAATNTYAFGGVGRQVAITGADPAPVYGTGGNGAYYSEGSGAANLEIAAPDANTGDGGRGSAKYSKVAGGTVRTGAPGGSGIVVVRYPI